MPRVKCVHHWKIESPAPKKYTLKGVCSKCNARKRFPNVGFEYGPDAPIVPGKERLPRVVVD